MRERSTQTKPPAGPTPFSVGPEPTYALVAPPLSHEAPWRGCVPCTPKPPCHRPFRALYESRGCRSGHRILARGPTLRERSTWAQPMAGPPIIKLEAKLHEHDTCSPLFAAAPWKAAMPFMPRSSPWAGLPLVVDSA